jgi:N-ethylmaleimide reductase
LRDLRRLWPAPLVLNRADADVLARVHYIEDGLADVITIGKLALANPDLVERLKAGAALNAPDPTTFYGGDKGGYVDYPALADTTSPRPAGATILTSQLRSSEST